MKQATITLLNLRTVESTKAKTPGEDSGKSRQKTRTGANSVPFVSVPERRKRLTAEGMAVLLLHLFYVGGLANNVYLFFRLYKSRSPPDYSYNSIALVQLLLNACNIITHAMLELLSSIFGEHCRQVLRFLQFISLQP